MKATLLSLIALGLIALATSSCSTAQGFGEDLQTLGRGIQRAAE
ncbi:MAG: entericidin A/B family lipoprotein [Verrucomicrobiota bacterium]